MSRRIVLATWGSFGDIHPYMALARELQRRGYAPSIATIPIYRDKIEAAGISFHPVRPDFPDPKQARDQVAKIIDRRRGAEYIFRELLGPHIRETYEDTLAAVTSGGDAAVIVSHVISVTAPLVAEKTGIPWVSTVLSPINFFSSYDPPMPPFMSWIHPLLRLHPRLAGVFTALGRKTTLPWVGPVMELRRELGLPVGKHPLFEGQHSPTRVLGLFSPVFGPPQPDFPPNTAITGFPFYDADEAYPADPRLEDFLLSGPPPMLFTLGSSAIWTPGDFYQVGLALAGEPGMRVILLIGDPENLPARLPGNVLALEYVPFGRVMPRVGPIVHQGGIGTTAQALRAGRPQLVMPFGHDTLDNARRVVRLGAGLKISQRRFRPGHVGHALKRLGEREFRVRAEAVGRRVRAEDGTARACDLIEEAISSQEKKD
jgi:rhamnosyltransferase subunit B